MIVLTQEQWYIKLQSYVPLWFFEESGGEAEADFWALAKVLETIQQVGSNHIKETYIDQATGEYLDEHGNDRNKVRTSDDTKETFRAKIKRIISSANLNAIKRLVDAILINGESTIIEHHSAENFCDAGAYLDRNVIGTDDLLYNFFSILVYHQIPEPDAFCDRLSFCDREDMIGSDVSDPKIFENIVAAVNANKAYGVSYRLIERVSEG